MMTTTKTTTFSKALPQARSIIAGARTSSFLIPFKFKETRHGYDD
jgi:hypothetical protein